LKKPRILVDFSGENETAPRTLRRISHAFGITNGGAAPA
jgi:hypothetical protein